MAANDVDRQPRAKRFACLAMGLIGVVLVGATPATAQFYDYRYYGYRVAPMRPPVPSYEEFDVPLNAREVSSLLRQQGLQPLAGLRREGDVYVTQVETRRGERLRVVVDAYDGSVIDRRLLARFEPRDEVFTERDLTRLPRRDQQLPPRQMARPDAQGGSRTQPLPPRPDRSAPSEKPVVTLPGRAQDAVKPGEAKPASPAAPAPAPARSAVIAVDPVSGAVKGAGAYGAGILVAPPAPVLSAPIPVMPLDDAARPSTPAVPVMPLE